MSAYTRESFDRTRFAGGRAFDCDFDNVGVPGVCVYDAWRVKRQSGNKVQWLETRKRYSNGPVPLTLLKVMQRLLRLYFRENS